LHLLFLTMDAFLLQGKLDTVGQKLARKLERLWRFFTFIVVAVLISGVVQPSVAQVHQDKEPQSRESFQRESPRSSPSSLPEWAEPGQSRDASPSRNAKTNATTDNGGAPPPPPDPDPVPVDGGLALLAAAGAGYAVRKLDQDDEDETIA